MSVIVKGMEMPKNCQECGLYIEGACYAKGYRDYRLIMDKSKPDDCPLVELPEKHGRLIDADAVNKAMDERIEKLKDDKSIYEASCVATALDMFAPTVIEAEGSET